MGKLDAQVAIIVGASRGMGAAIARTFAAEVALFVATFREALSIHEIDFSPTAHGW